MIVLFFPCIVYQINAAFRDIFQNLTTLNFWMPMQKSSWYFEGSSSSCISTWAWYAARLQIVLGSEFSAWLNSSAGKVRDVATQDLSLVCCLAANFSVAR